MSGLLLDTHVLLWWLSGDPRIKALAGHVEEHDRRLHASVVSLWELQIKAQLGKIELAGSLQELMDDMDACGIAGPLPFLSSHVLELERLPSIHKDPFDRALVCQARAEGLTLASHDEFVLRYPVEIWRI